MPFYDYSCKECGHVFEKLVRSQPGPSVLECPKCEQLSAMRKLSMFASPRGGRSAAPSCGPSGGG